MSESVDAITEDAGEHFEDTIERLEHYLTFPAISCDETHADDVNRLAQKIRDDLEEIGFANARVLELDGALPSVAAEILEAGDDKPTLMIYGHLDLQPVADEPWDTSPHEAVVKGDRLYARGSADDMGGWVSHLACIESWLRVKGALPLNIRIFIEGEEEIGSPNLERFMDAYPEAFQSDIMVLTDCENPAIDIPGLTVSLRGLLEIDLGCEALSSDVHSGLWGNMAPDVNVALMMLVANLVDQDGRLKYGRMEVDEGWRKAAWEVPLSDDVISKGARLVEGVEPLPHRGKSAAEWLWRQPAVTVLSTTLPRPGTEKNALRARASAVLSIRLAPGQNAEEMLALVEGALLVDPPAGIKVTIERRPGGAESWLYTPSGEAFVAADRAYEKAWGKKLLQVGIGGSIPFVALFGRRFGDLPLILNGVMDPATGAHGPNESMDLGVFRKTIMANIHLIDELGRLSSSLSG